MANRTLSVGSAVNDRGANRNGEAKNNDCYRSGLTDRLRLSGGRLRMECAARKGKA